MRTVKFMVLVALIVGAVWFWPQQPTPSPANTPAVNATQAAGQAPLPRFLPAQAHDTLARIAHHGPFRHRQDGSVFQNREGHLPHKPRGYYHEYTVETPGSRDRGARRIITGGNPPTIYYYTDDHYRSFHAFSRSL